MKHVFLMLAMALPMLAFAELKPTKASHIDADFVQVRQSDLLAEPQEMTGHFVYDAPSSVVWKYDDGAAATLPKEFERFIAKAVGGKLTDDNADFQVRQDGNTLYLTPKRKQLQQLFREISILFNSLTGIAQEVVLTEPTGDTTTITFSAVSYR